jgi:hypothetical protein
MVLGVVVRKGLDAFPAVKLDDPMRFGLNDSFMLAFIT